MRTTSLSLLVLLSLSTAACSGSVGPGDEPGPTFDVARSSLARDTKPDATPAELTALAEGNADFALRMHALLAQHSQDNVFFSPLSITTALSMAYAGAKGDTATEMAQALRLHLPAERQHVAMNALDLELASRSEAQPAAPSGKPFALRSVNTMFGQKGVPFESPFLDTLATSYGVGVQLADFHGRSEPERLKINAWVERQTEKKIRNLLGPGSISALTRLVLVNAVYFNADWAEPFEKEATRDQDFTGLDGGVNKVPTMHGIPSAGYAETEAYQALELPYMGNKVSMVFVLPRGDFRTFERSLDGKGLLSMFAGLKTSKVLVSLPKFEIRGDAVSLKKPLGVLGMVKAFDDGEADFSGIVSPSVEKLKIADVLHKAFLRVDEKGTEAAAATAVDFETTSAVLEQHKFTADRPFLVFIRDVPTNAVVFAGRIASPG